MKSNRSRFAGLVLTGLLAVACTARPQQAPDPFAGHYSASGGSSALPQAQALTKRFSELHPGVVWTLEDVGSDASVALVSNDDVDFGFISRELKQAEKGRVEQVPVGAVGTAVVVNAANPVNHLTKEQARQIFSGEVTNWSQVGGGPGKILVFVREPTASTRSAFESYVFAGKPAYAADAIEVDEIDETLKAIYSFRDAIGMATLGSRTLGDPQVRLLAIDGSAATRENLINGTYPIRRPLSLIFNLDRSKLKPAISAFLDFVRGAEGQKVLEGL